MTTAEDIKREHDAALASLTMQQHRALDRIREACRLVTPSLPSTSLSWA